jgi:YXWGXW repeat-containing protein
LLIFFPENPQNLSSRQRSETTSSPRNPLQPAVFERKEIFFRPNVWLWTIPRRTFLNKFRPLWRCRLKGIAHWARGKMMKLLPAVRLLSFGLLLLVIPAVLSSPSATQIAIGISVRIGPPALPVYEQPLCPGPGYLWTPGYWAWSDDDGYYWVPGTWVEAPEPGFLWTPGYWGWNDGVYLWNAGYWGPHIGFYGGINYGFGYGGNGFYGGEWRGGTFFYNTAVMHVNTTVIRNVYVNRTVIVNNNSHVAFNGGHGGVVVRPTPQQESYAHERHVPPVAAQTQQAHAASQNRAFFASTNHGRPAVAATARPGEFSGRGVVAAKAAGAAYHPPAMSPKEARAAAPAENRPAENRRTENRPAENHAAAPNGAKASNRPSVPPNKSNTANRPEKGNTARESAPRAPESHTAKPAPRPENTHPPNESRSENKPTPAPKVRESAPKESAPRASQPAPKPQKQAAPPKKASPPPKEEHKGR